ncbi:signal recognition particle subunit SRP72 [Parastagonospora nodorum]|nr:signal recognition particle subunit SRP72 [Parastagonospora nodorum]KAH4183546.1 signal recognition particle subunit SRP72 [Parastagonospora nodorum]KAH4847292.1 signal recognition particle subunit SRP72 [Parastagonospora nodorum]KAH5052988.1 signal recognition particle subunit SRP72 [Parastagonospora nodorum]KAH5110939.1 signal recognition particle subunit SRP72 [Parastagonospora nodorum]
MAASAKSLASLLAQASLEDHDEVLKAANGAIKKSKTDIEAHHVKAIALLNLDRYEDALEVFENTKALQEKASFEYAYALYKTGNAAKAVEVAEASGANGGRGSKHMLAQAAYRSENFAQAAKIYKELANQPVEDEEYDIRINSGAVDAQLEWTGQGELAQKKKPTREDLEVFETAFNAACGSISRGELAQAEVCLKRAKDLCNAASDLSESEKQAELMPITVQQVYVLTQLGKIDEAEALASDIPIAEIKELSTRYIAQVNSIAASKELSNPYRSHRLFHSSPKPPVTDQHFSFQSNILQQDEYVISLLSQKVAGVASSTEKVISATPAPSLAPLVNMAAVLNAAAHARNAETSKSALKEIVPLLEKRPTDVGLLLTITHLYVLTNNYAAATHLLESFFKRLEHSGSASDLDVRFAPGLIASLVALYATQSRPGAAKAQLAAAAEYWRTQTQAPSKALMVAAGTALLDTHNPDNVKQAGEIFKSLYDQDNEDRAAVAGLVAAWSISSPQDIPADLLAYLPEASRLIADMDAAALESAGVPQSTQTNDVARKRSLAPTKPVHARAKRLRKARVPKEYVEGKKMDEERWLPMRDRSYYRPKGRKGKKRAEGLTQGGVVSEEKGSAPTQVKKEVKGKKKKGGKW